MCAYERRERIDRDRECVHMRGERESEKDRVRECLSERER